MNAHRTAKTVYACSSTEAWAHVVVLALSQVQCRQQDVTTPATHALVCSLLQTKGWVGEFDRLKSAVLMIYKHKLQLNDYYMSVICTFIIFGYSVQLFAENERKQRTACQFQRFFSVISHDSNELQCLWTCHVSFDTVLTLTGSGLLIRSATQTLQWIAHNMSDVQRVLYYDEDGDVSLDVCVWSSEEHMKAAVNRKVK